MIVDVVMVMMDLMFDILSTWPGGDGAYQAFSQATTCGYEFYITRGHPDTEQ